jgi:hypothetical protein
VDEQWKEDRQIGARCLYMRRKAHRTLVRGALVEGSGPEHSNYVDVV